MAVVLAGKDNCGEGTEEREHPPSYGLLGVRPVRGVECMHKLLLRTQSVFTNYNLSPPT